MANFMARYRGDDGHYADVECAYAELERYVVLSCNEPANGKKKATSLVALVIRAMRRTTAPYLRRTRHLSVLYNASECGQSLFAGGLSLMSVQGH
jgi:hypothetical protein